MDRFFRSRVTLLLTIVALLGVPIPALSATINVPADYATIQAAIDAAVNGDTVLVSPGTYTENIDFEGKNITVGSLYLTTQDASYMSQTVIDGNANGLPVVRFEHGETDATLIGFTIQNGFTATNEQGAGINISGGSSPTLERLVIQNNISQSGRGGGIRCYYAGIPTIKNVTIRSNICSDAGGGILVFASSINLVNSIISSNAAPFGSGICFHQSGNANGSIVNCLISNNTGGGVITGSDIELVNCTLYGNSSAIDLYGESLIANSIVWGGHTINVGGILTVSYSSIEGGKSNINYPFPLSLVWGPGNIEVDPLFVSPENGDYHLRAGSPCIDSGTSEGAPPTDIEGMPRPQGAGFDMGAYEAYLPVPLIAYTPDPTNDNTPLLDWEDVLGASTYTVQYSEQPDFVANTEVTGLNETSYTVNPALSDGTWYWRVRAYDAQGVGGWWSWTDSFVVDTKAPTATISGVPNDPTNQTGATLSVGGEGVTHYRYKLDGGTYGGETAAATPIDLEGLTDGLHTVYVIARDAAGNWQAEGDASTASWIVDTVVPIITGLSDDPIPTQNKNWNWDANKVATFRHAIDQNEEWTPTGTFSDTKTATKSGVSGIWYLHVQAKDGAGNESDVTTVSASLFTVPEANTLAASLVQKNSATLNGTVNPNADTTLVTFDYGTGTDYGQSINATPNSLEGTTFQSVSANLTNLSPGTTYHFRVKGVNAAGTGYGEDRTFTTEAVLIPTVTTQSISSITQNSAQGGGNVTFDGGAEVTARGVCWGTSTNPTIADSKTVEGVGTGTFTSNISGLSPGTGYHVRAYATNSAGTGYGDNVSFTTSEAAPIVEIQSGNGPRGKTITLPIILTNITAKEVSAITVDVGYDSAVFKNPTALIGPAGSAAEKTIATNEVASGLFRITIFSTYNNDPIGDGVIVYLTLSILSNAPTSSAILACTPMGSNPSGGDVYIEGKDATVTILGNMEGDCDGDGTVTIAEVQSAINMYLGILPVLDCVDVNKNGKVSIGEVQKVINNHLGLTAPDMSVFSYALSPDSRERFLGESKAVEGTSLPRLIVGQTIGDAGDTVTVPVMLSNASGFDIAAISTDIGYDTSVLENPTVMIGPAGIAAGKIVTSNELSQGTFRVGILSASNNNAIGSGVVAYLTFTVKTASGRTALSNSPEGSDPLGNDVPMIGITGIVTAAEVIYVDRLGECGGYTPCFTSIQSGIDAATSYAFIVIGEGDFNEDVIVDQPYGFVLSGGWNSAFSAQDSDTRLNSLMITGTGASVEPQRIVLH